MKKVMVLVPVHCAPKVAMMTLGSWLEACDGSYEAEIILGVHVNYHHYHDGLPTLEALPVQFSFVPERDWRCLTPQDAMIRYSDMHAINLRMMLQKASLAGFDYLAILDHDLVFKTDFVGWSMNTDADLIGSYMGNRTEPEPIQTILGMMVFAPKFSVWHLTMSSRFYQKLMEEVDLISPRIIKDWFFDTFSCVIERNQRDWHLPVKALTEAEIGAMVEHCWSMSFNFGQYRRGVQDYKRQLREYEQSFDQRFPKGIGHLFRKVGL